MSKTNVMESYNNQLRKATKSNQVFPNDKSLRKTPYIVIIQWRHEIKG
ncbi:transposase [Clostridium beijerinckii]